MTSEVTTIRPPLAVQFSGVRSFRSNPPTTQTTILDPERLETDPAWGPFLSDGEDVLGSTPLVEEAGNGRFRIS